MPSIDVKLRKDHVPTWPDRCVVCERPSPNNVVDLATFQVTWWSTLTMSFGKREKLRAPACPTCAKRLVWERRGRSLLTLLAILATMFGLYRLIGLPDGFWRKPVLLGYGLIGIVPPVLIGFFSPAPLDVTSHSETIWYEFRSRRYALEFAMQNEAAVVEILR